MTSFMSVHEVPEVKIVDYYYMYDFSTENSQNILDIGHITEQVTLFFIKKSSIMKDNKIRTHQQQSRQVVDNFMRTARDSVLLRPPNIYLIDYNMLSCYHNQHPCFILMCIF